MQESSSAKPIGLSSPMRMAPADAVRLVAAAIDQSADLVIGSRLKGKIDEDAMPFSHRTGHPGSFILDQQIARGIDQRLQYELANADSDQRIE